MKVRESAVQGHSGLRSESEAGWTTGDPDLKKKDKKEMANGVSKISEYSSRA